ncbi:isoamyl acetate-hydrolyzing esterase [Rhizoclosmatium sp. JEL0117]|nr:isoamyl acetate-hydrolyzing esterase [Rhizoclosmatium sp. JEL0117]
MHSSGPSPLVIRHNQIVLIGDSLTEYGSSEPGGWASLLTAEYSRRATVLNRGYASYNSWWLKFAIEPLLRDVGNVNRIKLVTLMLGSNDYVNERYPKHVPLDMYIENMKEIIQTILRTAPHAKLLVMTPPPMKIRIAWDGEQSPSNPLVFVTIEDAKRYRDACLGLVDSLKKDLESRLDALDTWNLFIKNKKYENPSYDPSELSHLFKDNRHFNAEGNRVLFDCVVAKIASQWSELSAAKMETVLPLDWQNAPSALSGDVDGAKKWVLKNAEEL